MKQNSPKFASGTVYYSLPRKIEDKLDSRGLESQLVTLSMEPPPSAKRVAMQMFGWLCWVDGSFNENIFNECQLLLDRPRVCTNNSSNLII